MTLGTGSVPQPIDEAIIRAAQAGESWAWYRIVEEHQNMVYGLLRRWRNHDVDDVFQEVFLRIHKYLKGFRFESSLRTWIYQIAMNTLKTWGKQKAKQEGQEIPESSLGPRDPDEIQTGFLDSQPAEASDPIQALDHERRMATVRAVFASLPEREREILELRELQELSYEEIASVLSLELGTVRSRLSRARTALAHALQRKGVVSP
jgi:RNA polymerase sigma-70 factor (ECF subfamily)